MERPNEEDEADPQRKSQTYLEQVNVNRDFRELVDFLGSVRYRHIVPQLVRDPDRSIGRENDPFGGDFLDQLARTQARTLGSRLRRITRGPPGGGSLSFRTWSSRETSAAPRTFAAGTSTGAHKGAWQSEQELSDGTLRLLGFLWSVIEGRRPPAA